MKFHSLSFVLVLSFLGPTTLLAQAITGLPRVSPHARVEQTAGISTIAVDYHRPSINGRTVFGSLVPWDQVWRAGANDNTTFAVSDPVQVEGQDLPAGVYGLHMIPGQASWIVAFSTNSTSWGSFSYDPAEDALRVEVDPREAPHTEQLRYELEDVTNDGATLVMRWAETAVPIRITVDTQGLTLAKIRRDLRHLSGFSAQGFLSAANWASQAGVATEETLGWADRAIAMGGPVQARLARASLLEAQARGEEAAAELASIGEQGTEVDVNALGYFYLFQKQDAAKAREIFAANAAAHPDSWNVWDSLAEGTAAAGDATKAIELYQKAKSMAPQAQHARIDGAIAALR